MRLWISGGGTAGHVYPALTVLDACRKAASAAGEDLSVTWLGTPSGMERRLVTDAGIAFAPIVSAPLVGAGLKLPWNALRIGLGTLQAWLRMLRSAPDVLLVTGGYVSVPAALAARLRRIPVVIFLPDVRPGRAVDALARLATQILTTSPEALPHLPRDRSAATGYPVRESVRTADRGEARRRLGLHDKRPLLLVFGGSRGARRLNLATLAAAPELLPRIDILHVTGAEDFSAVEARRATLPTDLARGYRVRRYLDGDEMGLALAAADLVVSRAGAAVLGEYPARGLPSILVPLPISGGHQTPNARVLEAAGAAVVVDDLDLSPARLTAEVTALLDDPDRLAALGHRAAELDRPGAAGTICEHLHRIAARRRLHGEGAR